MVSRISYPKGKSESFLPDIRGKCIPKLNLEISQPKMKEISSKEKRLFGNFRRGPLKSAQVSKPRTGKGTESKANLVVWERTTKLPEEGLIRAQKGDARKCTPKRKNERNSPNAKDCQEYVKNYANSRILGCGSERENVLLARRREKKEKKSAHVKIPLQFAGDVIDERGDSHLRPYSGTNSKTLFVYKINHDSPIKVNKNKIGGTIPRHTTCLPKEKGFSFVRPIPRYLRTRQRHEPNYEDAPPATPNSTLVWEQHVLSLLSKKTAQWIANQCSEGEQRERLIYFLDALYDENEPDVSGTVRVRKLLDINDDCITVPKKRGEEKASKLQRETSPVTVDFV